MSDSDEEVVDKRLKLVLVGDSGSGKTSIATRYCNGEFTRHYAPTAGVDFFLKNFSLGDCRNITLHIWDVGGLALHGNILDKYIFGANVILFVYDVTNTSSFHILEEWIETIKRMCEELDTQPVMAIIGNKCDIEHQRTVKRDVSHKFAAENGIPCHDVSARTGESIAVRIAGLVAQSLGIRLTKSDQRTHKSIVEDTNGDKLMRKQSSPPVTSKVIKKPAKKINKTENNCVLPPSNSSICTVQ